MAKIVQIRHKEDGRIQCYYNCPGCGYDHAFSPSVHKWNGDVNVPTISPSLLHTNPQQYHVCHSFIKAGVIQFQHDCWHDLKGQIVQLPEVDVSHFDLDFVDIL